MRCMRLIAVGEWADRLISIVVERLSGKIRTFLHRLNGERHIGMACHDDDRSSPRALSCLGSTPSMPGMHVCDDAAVEIPVTVARKAVADSCRRTAGRLSQKKAERLANVDVVVNHMHKITRDHRRPLPCQRCAR